MKEFAQMAQDFVEATSMLVSHRTINIMDQNAVIIASTEKERIGTFHQGAAEVLQTGKPVLVLRENLKNIREQKRDIICRFFCMMKLLV